MQIILIGLLYTSPLTECPNLILEQYLTAEVAPNSTTCIVRDRYDDSEILYSTP